MGVSVISFSAIGSEWWATRFSRKWIVFFRFWSIVQWNWPCNAGPFDITNRICTHRFGWRLIIVEFAPTRMNKTVIHYRCDCERLVIYDDSMRFRINYSIRHFFLPANSSLPSPKYTSWSFHCTAPRYGIRDTISKTAWKWKHMLARDI